MYKNTYVSLIQYYSVVTIIVVIYCNGLHKRILTLLIRTLSAEVDRYLSQAQYEARGKTLITIHTLQWQCDPAQLLR